MSAAPQNNNGDLASVPDKKINIFLKSRVSEGEKQLWIGGKKKDKVHMTWAWSDNTPWTWDSWATGQPNNNGGDQDYVVINYGGAGNWDDDNEDRLRGFICQYHCEFQFNLILIS